MKKLRTTWNEMPHVSRKQQKRFHGYIETNISYGINLIISYERARPVDVRFILNYKYIVERTMEEGFFDQNSAKLHICRGKCEIDVIIIFARNSAN